MAQATLRRPTGISTGIRAGRADGCRWVARSAWLSILLAGPVSCQNTSAQDNAGELAVSAEAPHKIPARRPARKYFLGRTAERCEVFVVEGDQVSVIDEATCPVELQVGERIRLAGKTCFREGGRASGEPVVCPDPLKSAELDARAAARDAGGDR